MNRGKLAQKINIITRDKVFHLLSYYYVRVQLYNIQYEFVSFVSVNQSKYWYLGSRGKLVKKTLEINQQRKISPFMLYYRVGVGLYNYKSINLYFL